MKSPCRATPVRPLKSPGLMGEPIVRPAVEEALATKKTAEPVTNPYEPIDALVSTG